MPFLVLSPCFALVSFHVVIQTARLGGPSINELSSLTSLMFMQETVFHISAFHFYMNFMSG